MRIIAPTLFLLCFCGFAPSQVWASSGSQGQPGHHYAGTGSPFHQQRTDKSLHCFLHKHNLLVACPHMAKGLSKSKGLSLRQGCGNGGAQDAAGSHNKQITFIPLKKFIGVHLYPLISLVYSSNVFYQPFISSPVSPPPKSL